MDMRPTIISEFNILRSVAPLEAGGTFKVRAYDAAIAAVSGLPPLYDEEDLPKAKKGDGLSRDMREKISFILLNGQLDIPPDVRRTAESLRAFQGIYGVGPKSAQKLIEAGFSTIEQLRAAVAVKPALLNKNQHVGLAYYEELQMRIPRAEMELHRDLLFSCKPPELEGVIVGSFRRGRPDSGDIDMLISTAHPSVNASKALADYVKRLQACEYMEEVLAHGDHKNLSIVRLTYDTGVEGYVYPARRLDLLVTPPEEMPFAVFYFTGCDTFNVAVRAHAQTLGYTLNEHALTHVKSGARVEGLRSEEEIFAFLKLRWTPPEERTGADKVVVVA